MTKMEKLALVVALLECAFLGYAKYMVMTTAINKAIESGYFEDKAKRQIARQRQKFCENATESDAPSGAFGFAQRRSQCFYRIRPRQSITVVFVRP